MNNRIVVLLKKWTSSLLAFLMLLSSFMSAPVAMAVVASTPTLTIGSQSALNGATINVPLNASGFLDVGSIDFGIQYDSSLLAYAGYVTTPLSGSFDSDSINSDGDTVVISWPPQSTSLGNGEILTLIFTVISATSTDAPLTVVGAREMGDVAGNAIESSFVGGVIQLNPPAMLTSIAITTPANKLSYTVGDSLDLTGLVVTGTYDDASTKTETITTANITGFDSSEPVRGQILTVNVGGQTATYTVDILSAAKNIISFSFSEGIGVIDGNNIAVTVPFGTNVSALVPTIVISTNASVNPASGVAQNFTSTVTYTVTAENGSNQIYTVTVTVSVDPDIALLAADKAALVDDLIKGANADLSNITSALTNPLPTSGANGSTISWRSSNLAVVSNDGQTVNRPLFADGDAIVTLTATLTKGAVTDTKAFPLTVLKLPASNVATITSDYYAVSAGGTNSETIINVPFGTMVYDFIWALKKGEAHQVLDESGISSPVKTGDTLKVTAQDGVTVVVYTITVSDDPDIALVAADRDVLFYSAIVGGNVDKDNITMPLADPLPSIGSLNGSVITWLSSKPDVISDDGRIVNRPSYSDGDATVILKATLTKGAVIQAKEFTLIVIKLPASTVATVTSTLYTVSAGGTGSETIIGIPFGTAKAVFIAALTKGEAHQTWIDSDISDPVATGNTLKVTAEDGLTSVVYTLTVDPDLSAPTGSITNISANAYLKGNVTLNADASDIGSGVAKVEFWNTNAEGTSTKIGEDISAPFSIDWNTTKESEIIPDGSYTLFLKISDNAGNSYQSENISVKVDNNAPTVTKLGDNSADVSLAEGNTDLVFSEVLSDGSKTAVQNALTAGADKTLSYSWTDAILTITATGTTTFANDVVVNVTDLAGFTAHLLLVDSKLKESQTTPDDEGAATINNTTSQVVVTNPTQAVTVTVGSDTTNPTIDVGSFIAGGTGSIPSLTINSSIATVTVPTATTITSSDTSWDGVIAAPRTTTVTLPEITGFTTTLSTALEVGFTGAKLSFDKGVRILFPNQAGKKVGYVRTGITFTEITNACEADSQATGDALAADGDCKIDVGSDLVVWTKHFTTFATYTQTAIVVVGVTGGCCVGGGGGGAWPFSTPILQNNGQVLGVKTQLIPDGSIVKLRGKKQYYLINKGKRKLLTKSELSRKYPNEPIIEIEKEILVAFPLLKKPKTTIATAVPSATPSEPVVPITEQAIPQKPEQAEIKKLKIVKIWPRSVRVWSGLGSGTKVIGGTWTGEKYYVLEEQDGWYRILWNKGSAWIDGRWAEGQTVINLPADFQPVNNPAPEVVAEAPSPIIGIVKVMPRSVRVWSGLGTKTHIIGGTWMGEQFKVIEEKDGWYRVVWHKGSAWIDGRWVSKM